MVEQILPSGSKTLFHPVTRITLESWVDKSLNTTEYLQDFSTICMGSLKDHNRIIRGSKRSYIGILNGSQQDLDGTEVQMKSELQWDWQKSGYPISKLLKKKILILYPDNSRKSLSRMLYFWSCTNHKY